VRNPIVRAIHSTVYTNNRLPLGVTPWSMALPERIS
jgi:hypothetical protein